MTNSTEALLSLRGVGRTYPGPVPVLAVRPTTLDINAGDYVGVVGPSGSGKSTFLNILGLLDSPTEGRYRVGGAETGHLGESVRTALRAHVFGFVFQSYHLLQRRSVVENVEMGMLYKRVTKQKRRDRALEALGSVGLSHRVGSIPANLSGGERQRVAIARALVADPSVLLCDEPTGNLDSDTSRHLLDLFDDLHRSGLTIVVITHDLVVGGRTSRLLEIRDGKVTELR